METEEQDEISSTQRQLYLSRNLSYDTTTLFPSKPLPENVKVAMAADIANSIESLRKIHTADMVVSVSPTDSNVSVVSTKNRAVQYDIITIDSMSMYNE